MLGAQSSDHASQRFQGGSLFAAGNNHGIARAWSDQLSLVLSNKELEEYSNRLYFFFHQEAAQLVAPESGMKSRIDGLRQLGLKLDVATGDSFHAIEHTRRNFDFFYGYDSGHGIESELGMV